MLTPTEGGWGIEPPEEAGPAYASAVTDCLAEVGEITPAVMSEEFASQVWEREISTHTCLKDNGFDVPDYTMDKETFVAQSLATGMTPWNGYDGFKLDVDNPEIYEQAWTLCPNL